jgi:hypothetical protein
MTARRPAVLAAAAVLVAALTACTPAAGPTPSPTPTGFASEMEAFAAAEETYRAYVDALNEIDLAAPETFQPLFDLTTGELNELDRESFSALHADDNVVSGETTVISITPIDASSEEVRLSTCIDVSDVELTDSEGNSLVDEDRPDIRAETVTIQFVKPGVLKLSSIGDGIKGNQCAS